MVNGTLARVTKLNNPHQASTWSDEDHLKSTKVCTGIRLRIIFEYYNVYPNEKVPVPKQRIRRFFGVSTAFFFSCLAEMAFRYF